MKTGRDGFGQIDLMIQITVLGVGAALVVPPVSNLVGGRPVSTGGWISLVVGGVLALVGLVLILKDYVVPWLRGWPQD